MSTLTYSISREAAASFLGVSTRTIDRYVKSGKLSYKKIANKVILAKEQVDALKEEFTMLHEETPQSEIVSGQEITSSPSQSMTPMNNTSIRQLDQKMDKFFELIREKDQYIEDKNKMIFILQQKLGELEGRLQHMIALPAYQEEKQTLIHEKDKLEQRVKDLHREYKREKRNNIIFLSFMAGLVLIAIVFTLLSR